MSIINSSHAIGVDTKNLVLKTRGTLHVKVGSRYYELDFRNLNSKLEESEKEEFILTLESKDQVEQLDYPGDNKLIISLDGSLFVTKGGSIIEITVPSKQSTSTVEQSNLESQIKKLNSVYIEDKLYGESAITIDFVNGEITTDSLIVNREIKIPNTGFKKKCTKTYKSTKDTGEEYIETRYLEYDFIEIVESPLELAVKSGVIIKSNVDITIPVFVDTAYSDAITFETAGTYILYDSDGEIVQTKLN